MASLLDLVTHRSFQPMRIAGGLFEIPEVDDLLGASKGAEGFILSDGAAERALDTAMETLADEIDAEIGDARADDGWGSDACEVTGLSMKAGGLPETGARSRWVEFAMPEVLAELAPLPGMGDRVGCLFVPCGGPGASGRLAVFVQQEDGSAAVLPVDMRFDRMGAVVLADDEDVSESPAMERFVLLAGCLAADALQSMEMGLAPRMDPGPANRRLVGLGEPVEPSMRTPPVHLGWLAIADAVRGHYGVLPMVTPNDPERALPLHRRMVEHVIQANRTAIRDATGRDPGALHALMAYMLDSDTPGNPEGFFPMTLVTRADHEVVGIARDPSGRITLQGFPDLPPDHGRDVQEGLQAWLEERRSAFGQRLAPLPRPGL